MSQAQDSALRVKKLALDLHVVEVKCPQRIWPQRFLEDVQIIFVEPKNTVAWVIPDLKFPDFIKKINSQELPAEFRGEGYGLGEINGKETVSVNLEMPEGIDRGADPAFVFAYHEGFHKFAETSWNLPFADADVSSFPLEWQPRYFRAQEINALRKAVLSSTERGIQEALSKAGFWNSSRKKYQDEIRRTKLGI